MHSAKLGAFFYPRTRSRSFSYGTLSDYSDNALARNADARLSLVRPPSGNSGNRSEDERIFTPSESTPLLSDGLQPVSANSTPTPDKKTKGVRSPITRIIRCTPPLFPSSDADLQRSSMRISNDDEIGFGNAQTRLSIPGNERNGGYSKKDKFLVAILSTATFLATIVYSCIAPFFPEEAKKKGASASATGLVFGVFELVMFIMCPIYGRYLTRIGSNFMYGTGLCVTGITAMLFGLLNMAPAGLTFLLLAIIIRVFEAIGDAAIVTAAFTIVAKTFTTRVATVIGIMETFNGMGFAAGPPIGGALYEIGGFQMPFMLLGSLLIIGGFSSFWILPKQSDAPTEFKGSICHLLRIHTVWTMVCVNMIAAISISFLDPTLQPHIKEFNLSPLLVGFMFLIIGGFYALSAPFWGYLIDRKDCAKYVVLFGCVFSFVALIFIGPSPIFPFKKQIWIVAVSEIFMGIGLGALMIPPFQQCLLSARRAGYPDTFETYGIISGLFQASLSFGAFIGPTVGGLSVERFGFPWTATVLSSLHIICAILVVILMLRENQQSNNSEDYGSLIPYSRSVSLASPRGVKPSILCSE